MFSRRKIKERINNKKINSIDYGKCNNNNLKGELKGSVDHKIVNGSNKDDKRQLLHSVNGREQDKKANKIGSKITIKPMQQDNDAPIRIKNTQSD